MKAARPADEDRLPWLEPYRETMAQHRRVGRSSHGRLVALVAVLLLLPMAIAGGYWLGQRGAAPVPASRSSETIPLPAPRPQPQPVQVAEAPPVEPQNPAAATAAAEPAKAKARPAKRRATVRRPAPLRKIRTAGVERAHIEAVRTAQEHKPAPPPPASRVVWPKMPSPGPAGQVIQLGAFTTPARASNAYHQRVARYPTLARMPRVIVPVATRPGNRVLYVLRLGTTSRQQSKMVCRNLRRSGDHCLVIG